MTTTELYKRYMDLGKQIKALEDERKNLKESEISFLLDSGEKVGEGGKHLAWVYKTRSTFNPARAISLGYMTAAQVAECMDVTGWREVRELNLDESEAERIGRENALRARLQFTAAGVPTFDGEPVRVEVKA